MLRPVPIRQTRNDDGYMLLAVVVLVFLVLLALSVAAPRMAMQLKHDQEIETRHRAEQYTRAIRVYYRKFHTYPPSIDALVNKTNNVRFLRQKYPDPLTGKDDWRLIHVGENKTQVKGLFGQDLGGLGGTGIGGGLGAASSSSTSGSSSGILSGSSGGTSGSSGGTGTPLSAGFSNSGSSSSASGTSGTSGTTGSGTGSTDATNATGGGGQIMGVGVPKQGIAMLTVNEQTNYQDWEFLYDPRIEQLMAASALNGGNTASPNGSGIGGSGTGSSSGSGAFGNSGSGSSLFGTSGPGSSNGNGTNGNGSSGSGSSGTGSGGTTPPQ